MMQFFSRYPNAKYLITFCLLTIMATGHDFVQLTLAPFLTVAKGLVTRMVHCLALNATAILAGRSSGLVLSTFPPASFPTVSLSAFTSFPSALIFPFRIAFVYVVSRRYIYVGTLNFGCGTGSPSPPSPPPPPFNLSDRMLQGQPFFKIQLDDYLSCA